MGNVNIIASVSLDCCVVVVTPFCCLILFFFWFLDGCFLVGVVVVAAGLWKERSEFGNWFSDVVCCWEGLLGLNHWTLLSRLVCLSSCCLASLPLSLFLYYGSTILVLSQPRLVLNDWLPNRSQKSFCPRRTFLGSHLFLADCSLGIVALGRSLFMGGPPHMKQLCKGLVVFCSTLASNSCSSTVSWAAASAMARNPAFSAVSPAQLAWLRDSGFLSWQLDNLQQPVLHLL